MTLTIRTTDGNSVQVTGKEAPEVLIQFDLPMQSPWVKVRIGIGWHWINRNQVTGIIVSDQ